MLGGIIIERLLASCSPEFAPEYGTRAETKPALTQTLTSIPHVQALEAVVLLLSADVNGLLRALDWMSQKPAPRRAYKS